jgi:hypothetical protein
MPVLKPSAGLEPIWATVLAQMEHWAKTPVVSKEKQTVTNNMKSVFFIFWWSKDTFKNACFE